MPYLPCTRWRTRVQLHLTHRGCAPLFLRHCETAAVAARHSRPVPSSTRIAALLPSRYVHERIQTQTGQRKLTPPLHFKLYFGRLLIESKRIAATYRRSQEACGDEVLPGQPHATPGPSSCPNGAGGISLERCATPCGNAACAAPRRLHLAHLVLAPAQFRAILRSTTH